MMQAVVSRFSHVKPGDMEYLQIISRPADFKTVDVPPAVDKVPTDLLEVIAMSSPEELTFVVGRWLRPIVVVLDVVRRLGLRTTSSREQRSTALNQ